MTWWAWTLLGLLAVLVAVGLIARWDSRRGYWANR